MSKRGGYKIIDLKGKPLKPEVGMVYDGIYEQIEETQKPILISGLVVDVFDLIGSVIEYKDFYAIFNTDGTAYRYANTELQFILEVNDRDIVTIMMIEE